MDKIGLAESLLKLVCGRNRAAEIVGDLLEDKSEVLTIWLAVAQVIFTWTWRWLVGVLLAAASSVALMFFFAKLFMLRTASPVVQENLWASASLCLCSALAINICRFGMRDRVTAVASCVTLLLVGAACADIFVQAKYSWLGATLLFGLGIVNSSTKRSLLVLTGAAGAYAGILGLLMLVILQWPGTRSPAAFMFCLPCCWLIGLFGEACVLAKLRELISPHALN